jgi:hypothetical protein
MQIDVFDKEMKYDEDKIMEKLLDGKQETYPLTILPSFLFPISSNFPLVFLPLLLFLFYLLLPYVMSRVDVP